MRLTLIDLFLISALYVSRDCIVAADTKHLRQIDSQSSVTEPSHTNTRELYKYKIKELKKLDQCKKCSALGQCWKKVNEFGNCDDADEECEGYGKCKEKALPNCDCMDENDDPIEGCEVPTQGRTPLPKLCTTRYLKLHFIADLFFNHDYYVDGAVCIAEGENCTLCDPGKLCRTENNDSFCIHPDDYEEWECDCVNWRNSDCRKKGDETEEPFLETEEPFFTFWPTHKDEVFTFWPTPSPTPKAPIPGKKPSPRKTPPVAKTSFPVAKTSSPVAKTSSPVAKTSSPVAKTSSPVAKTSSPEAETLSPVAKTSSPVAKTSSSVAMTSSPVMKSANKKAVQEIDLSEFGYSYTWPTDNGWLVAPSYANKENDTYYYNKGRVDSVEECAKFCGSKGTPGGSYMPKEKRCFCDKVLECLEPVILEEGGIVFSTEKSPDFCPKSYCSYFPQFEEYCRTAKRKAPLEIIDNEAVDLYKHGYTYNWPTEEGWFVAPSYAGLFNSDAYYYNKGNIKSLDSCARYCEKKGTPGGYYLPQDERCFCDKSPLECLEPVILLRGGTVFSSERKPEVCPKSFCDYFPEQTEFCDMAERKGDF